MCFSHRGVLFHSRYSSMVNKRCVLSCIKVNLQNQFPHRMFGPADALFIEVIRLRFV